jgi:polar amino acid transport system substrate-binding protein
VIAEEIQLNQIFAAAIVADAREPDAAKRLIAFLSSDAASAAMKRGGMEPATRQVTKAVVSDAARAELAPTGKLRAGMNLGNTLFTTKDAATGELRGVSVDLMRELASRLGVSVDFVVHETPGDVADAVDKGTWDVAVLAIAQARARTIAFSPPMTEIEATYVVHKDSPLRSSAQMDAPSIRIAAADKAGYELYLTQTLQKATLIRPKGNTASIELFNARGADALAALKPDLLEWMSKMPEARIVEGNFMIVNHGLTTPRARLAAAAYLKAFVEEMNASGFIARSILRNGVQGLSAVK